MSLTERLARDGILTATAFQVLCAITAAPGDGGDHVISQKDLIATTGRSRNAIRRAIEMLEERGYVLVTRDYAAGGFWPTYHYHVVTQEA